MKIKEITDLIGLFTGVNIINEGETFFVEENLSRDQLRQKYGEEEIFQIHSTDDWTITIEIEKN